MPQRYACENFDEDGPRPDPYPALPVIPREALRDGDVLMMLGQGYSRIGRIDLPVS